MYNEENIKSLLERLGSISDFVALCTNSFGNEVDSDKLQQAVSKYYKSQSANSLQAIHKILQPAIEDKMQRMMERAAAEENDYETERVADGVYKFYGKTSLAQGNLPETVFAANPSYIGVYTVTANEDTVPTCTCPEYLSRMAPFSLPCKHIVMLQNKKGKQVISHLVQTANSLDQKGYEQQADELDHILTHYSSLARYAQSAATKSWLPKLLDVIKPILGGKEPKQVVLELVKKLTEKGIANVEQWLQQPENQQKITEMIQQVFQKEQQRVQATHRTLIKMADLLDKQGELASADEVDRLLEMLTEGTLDEEEYACSGLIKTAIEDECPVCDYDLTYEDLCPRCGWMRNACTDCGTPTVALTCPGCKGPIGIVKRAGILGPLAGGALGAGAGLAASLAGAVPSVGPLGLLTGPAAAGIGGLLGAGAGTFVGHELSKDDNKASLDKLIKIANELESKDAKAAAAIRRIIGEAQVGQPCVFCGTPYDEEGVCETCGALSPLHKCGCYNIDAACTKCGNPLGEMQRNACSGQLTKYAIAPAAIAEMAAAIPGVGEAVGGIGEGIGQGLAEAIPKAVERVPQVQENFYKHVLSL